MEIVDTISAPDNIHKSAFINEDGMKIYLNKIWTQK